MSNPPPTIITIYLGPKNEEGALYHLDEAITEAGIGYTVIDKQEQRITLEAYAPFVVSHQEQRITLALHTAPGPGLIKEIADLIPIVIFGFTFKGEIDLSDEGGIVIINNLEG